MPGRRTRRRRTAEIDRAEIKHWEYALTCPLSPDTSYYGCCLACFKVRIVSSPLMCPGKVTIEADGLLELGDGGVVLTLGVKRTSQGVVRRGIVRFEAEGLFELGDGGIVLALGVKRRTQAVARRGIVRSEPKGFLVLGDRCDVTSGQIEIISAQAFQRRMTRSGLREVTRFEHVAEDFGRFFV